ncbi:hypothetical protein NKJ93_02310 [Mesorhizobium sp. M0028]|uniref:hypothetical protein n=1 Tax=Mesorhizobium sp. M0028 TaxID=2956849 RepID=UPI003337E64C
MRNLTGNLVFRSIAVQHSNVTFSGMGAVLRQVSHTVGLVSGDVQPMFATDKNMTVGTIKDINFVGISFDSNNNTDAVNSNQRGFYIVGVDGLRFTYTIGHSTGTRRGYFAHLDNSKNIQVTGHRHDKMTGGYNVRFCENFVMTNFIFKDFSEAIDLDGPSKRVVIRSGIFEGTDRTKQCIDINDQIDASIGDFCCYFTGTIALVNYKTTTPETYAEYVVNAPVRNFQVGKRIILSNITGYQIGDAVNSPSFFIGWDWAAGNHAGAAPVQDITLDNIYLDDAGFIQVLEATGLVLKNVTLRGGLSSATYAAVDMRSSAATADQIAYSDLDAQIDGMRVEGAQRGGVKISAASRAVVKGLMTKGNNTLGGTDSDLTITGMETRACRAVVDDCDIEGTVTLTGDSTTIAAWAANTFYKKNAIRTNGGNFYKAVAEGYSAAATGPTTTGLNELDDGSALAATWAGSTAYVVDNVVKNGAAYFICMTAGTSAATVGPTGTDLRIADGTAVWRPINGAVRWEYMLTPYSVRWGKNNRVRGTVAFNGDVQKYIYGESIAPEVGDLAATGVVNKSVFVARRRTLITRVSYQTTAAVVADPTNYRSLLLRRYRAGVPTTVSTIDTTTTGFTASVYRDGGVTASPAGAYMEPGDILQLTSNVGGTGVAISGLGFTVDFIEF